MKYVLVFLSLKQTSQNRVSTDMTPLRAVGNRVFVDTETTGLSTSDGDEMLELAVIDISGNTLFNSLIRPIHKREWPKAQAIHGITPSMVADAPTLAELSPTIKNIFDGADVIIYNAQFDSDFLGDLLAGANQVHCCMLDYSKFVGAWSDFLQAFRWHSLATAAADACFEWPGESHRAQADALACRAVWRYITDETEQLRVNKIKEEKRQIAKVLLLEESERHREAEEADLAATHITEFLEHWYLGRYGIQKHWINDVPTRDIENTIANLFWGMPIRCLDLLDSHDIIYNKISDIPAHLVSARHFKRLNQKKWFMNELKSSAAYVGSRQGWALYDKSEYDRIAGAYPLRMNSYTLLPNEKLFAKSALLKMGYSANSISDMRPVEERQNRYDSSWYYLYAVIPPRKK